jgi:hypothetical protein
MNKLKIGQWILWIAFLFFLTYNTLFGWNRLPINEAEKVCDEIFKWAFRIGIGFTLLPITDWYFDWAKEYYRKRGEGISGET